MSLENSSTASNVKVLDSYGIASIVLAVLGIFGYLGILFFPIGVLLSLRAKRSGSKFGLTGLIINSIGTLIVYGGIVAAILLPIIASK